MNSSQITHSPLRLLKNRRYPTYQLYAVTNSKKAPETVLIFAVLQTMQWLRERFRDFEIPDEINMPDADKYESLSLEDLKSFNLYDGYKVEAIWLPKEKNWTLQLTEPDLGPSPGNAGQYRQPVPGRLVETNIAYRIKGDRVECGFRTVIAEPEGTEAPCEVFRLAVIKHLARNPLVGLEHGFKLSDYPLLLDKSAKIKRLIDWIKDKDRMIPVIIATESKKEEKQELPSLDQLIASSKKPFGHILTAQENLLPEKKFYMDMNALARYKMGYAQYFQIPIEQIEAFSKLCGHKLSEGDLLLWEPIAFGGDVKIISAARQLRDSKGVADEINNFAQNYPKDKPFIFGDLLFLPDARKIESTHILELSESKAELLSAFLEKEQAVAMLHREEILSKEELVILSEEKIERLKNYISELKEESARRESEFNEKLKKLSMAITEKDAEIDRLLSLDNRPQLPGEVSKWVETQFAGKMIFHQKAIDLMSAVLPNEVDLRILCDALEYLASDYRDNLLSEIDGEELKLRCSKKYGRPFEVVPLTGPSIEAYPAEYKIKYYIGRAGKPVESLLDLHLRVGVSSENLLRIYFLYDKEKKLIVVGSLPKHLKTISYK